MRIVSLSPSLTDICKGLGATDALIGASGETLGSPKAIQISRLEFLKPDYVLADTRNNRPEEIQLIQKKWRTKVFDVKSPQAVCDAMAEIGRLVGREGKAKKLNQSIHHEMELGEKFLVERGKRKTVLLIWDQPYLTVNFDSYPSRLIEASGGLNVFREESLVEFPIEIEDMVEKEPEVLLLAGEPAPFRTRHVSQFRKYRILSKIPIHVVEGNFLTHYGTQTAEALGRLRKIYETL
ncbi:MAG: ABC transporter substrate-binding protein [Candidatus Omnitrophica bacterium]|nr:ABC transporter substrate-binding protein [Candidatus Omnitrophota bacterium]